MTTESAQVQPGWDESTAQWYLRHYAEVPLHRLVPGLCGIQPGKAVLDIGCGSGSVLAEIARQSPGCRLVGVDPTAAMLEAAKHTLAGVEDVSLYSCGAESLALADNSIDVAVAVCTLHHWGDIVAGLAEVRRVLKPGGRLVVVDELWDEWADDEAALAELPSQPEGQPHCQLLDGQQVSAALAAAGFGDLSLRKHREPGIAVVIVDGRHPSPTQGD